MDKKLEQLFKTANITPRMKEYILGKKSKYKNNYYYNWEVLISGIKKILGLDHKYTFNTIELLLKSNEYNKIDIFFNLYKKNTKEQLEAIEDLIDLTNLPITEVTYLYFSTINNLNPKSIKYIDLLEILKYLYNLDEKMVKKAVSIFNNNSSTTESGGYVYNNLNGLDLYLEALKKIMSESDFKELMIKHAMKGGYNSKFFYLFNFIEENNQLDILLQKVPDILKKLSANQETQDLILNYLKTGEYDKKLDKLIKKIATHNKSWLYYNTDFTNFMKYKKPNPNNTIEQRMITLSMKIDKYRTFEKLIFNKYNKEFFSNNRSYFGKSNNKVIFSEIDTLTDWEAIKFKNIIDYLTYLSSNSRYYFDEKKYLKKYLKDDSDKTFKALAFSGGKGLEASLDLFNEFDKDKTYNFIIENIAIFSGKNLINEVVDILYSKKESKVLQKLALHKKAKVREIAVRSLIKLNEKSDIDFLTIILEKERSKVVQNLIMEYLSVNGFKDKLPTDNEKFTKSWFLKKANKSKGRLPNWLKTEDLPKLHWLDNKKELTEKEIIYFISLASSNKKVIPSEAFRKFGVLVNNNDLKLFSSAIYKAWNREAKTKWALAFVAGFGDDSAIKPIKDEILDFISRSRGSMASQMVEAIAMIGSTKAFQTVDWFSKKVRHKQVKRAANEALTTAAKELNISKEDLLDKIIPNFGFNKEGLINLDYGKRNFNIKLNPDLTFLITDNKGKKFKNLPKPSKNDDTEIATKSSKFFKELKKEVKNQVKLQKNRLENGFTANRLWSFNKWSELFIKNPMMKQFALTLLWGEYDKQGNLLSEFRFLEDGSFINIDEDEITLTDSKIGLVHPIELSSEKLDAWREQLDDYEIIQPFLQLERKVFKVDPKDSNKLFLDDFMGYLIGRSALKSKLFNKNWNRGSVQDAGCFYEYYKEFEFYGIGVELSFEGDCVGGYDEYGDVPIKEITFYVAKSVQRGSYIYDKPATQDTFSLGQIPKRLYSEIYHEIKTIAESGKGFDPEWEKKEWW